MLMILVEHFVIILLHVLDDVVVLDDDVDLLICALSSKTQCLYPQLQ